MISAKNDKNTSRFSDLESPQSQLVATPTYNDYGEEIFRAGQFVMSGCYVEVDGSRQVYLEQSGTLPASLDGRRATYRRLERPWINSMSNSSRVVS